MKTDSSITILVFILPILLAISLFGCTYGQHEPQLSFTKDKISEIDSVIKCLYMNGQFSGTVLVSVKGEIIYTKAVGYAKIEDSVLNTIDTKYRIASFTKPFTSLLIIQLFEDGLIKLDGKLIEYLPQFNIKGGEKITIHQLLTHKAGITGESRIPNLIDIEKLYYSRSDLLDCIMKYDLVNEPGTKYEYSNFGYALLGLVIEEVTGMSYDEVLNEKICTPAGMTNTLSEITDQTIEKRANGYTYNYFSGLEKSSFLDMSFCLGAGQLLSTVEDLYLFDKALYLDKLLPEKARDYFFNVSGWRLVKYPYGKGSKSILSNNLDGSVNGFQSHTQRIENDSVLIITLRNVKEAIYENEIVIKWANSIASPILSILYNEEYELTKMSGAFVVFKTLIESGLNKAENKFFDIIKQQEKYYIDKSEFEFFEEELKKKNMAIEADKIQTFIQKI